MAKKYYALRYIAHPEDVEFGADKDGWFQFRIGNRIEYKFESLEDLMDATMEQLKPNKDIGFARVYRIEGRARKEFAELYLRVGWEADHLFYSDTGRKVSKGTTVLWYANSKKIYAVGKDRTYRRLVHKIE